MGFFILFHKMAGLQKPKIKVYFKLVPDGGSAFSMSSELLHLLQLAAPIRTFLFKFISQKHKISLGSTVLRNLVVFVQNYVYCLRKRFIFNKNNILNDEIGYFYKNRTNKNKYYLANNVMSSFKRRQKNNKKTRRKCFACNKKKKTKKWSANHLLKINFLFFSITDSDGDENHRHMSNSKKERFFWQYNVQAKGPKGQRLVIKKQLEDPHVLNEITDPVFSPHCSVRGIKVKTVFFHYIFKFFFLIKLCCDLQHSGKARKGDGNDLTPNPRSKFFPLYF